MSESLQLDLSPSPTDIPSSLVFHPQTPTSLLVSSWDSTLRYYTISTNPSAQLISQYNHPAPILDCAFSADGRNAITASVNGNVNLIDLETAQLQVLDSHDKGCRCVLYSSATNSIISGSWDKTFRLHSLQPGSSSTIIPVPEKIFTMDIHENTLVMGMSNRLNYIYDLRKLDEPLQRRESSLKFMTRAIKLTPTGDAFVSSSIEGRIAYDWINPAQQSQNYAFRAHRIENPTTKVNTVYPVNTLAFHPIHGTFASGGGDGSIAIWDPAARKRVKYYAPDFGGSIASLGFSGDGRWMGVAVSMGDDGSGAVEGSGAGRVIVRELGENEGKRKA